MDVSDLGGRTALVTGAASGIGRSLAFACARRGADLVLCDVAEEGLAETASQARALGSRVRAERVDVSDEAAMRGFAEAVHADLAAVDLLFNNAGVGLGGGFLDTTLEDWDWILGINLRGVVLGCHFFVPPMVRRGRGGHVVNVSSMAAFAPGETLAAYATTKCAVLGLSEALAEELAPHGIGVTAACPGLIDTPIVQSTRMRGAAARPEVRAEAARIYKRRGYGPDRVARNVLRAVQRNRIVAPISPESWLGYGLRRLSPGLLRALSRRISRRSRAAGTDGG